MTRIRWTLRAVSDLKAISSYIEQRRNLVAANRVCRIIYDAVEVLRRCPEIGKPGLEEGTRELVVPALAAYVVVYRILQADAVEIVESGTAHSSGKNNQPESRSSPRLVAGEAARRRKTCGRADFADLTRGRMAVLISHRFSTVSMADRILVLADGEVVEQGTHQQLVALGGRYAELFELQAAGYR